MAKPILHPPAPKTKGSWTPAIVRLLVFLALIGMLAFMIAQQYGLPNMFSW